MMMRALGTHMLLTTLLIGSVALATPPPDDLLGGPNLEEEEITSQDMTDRVFKEQGKSNKAGSRKQSRMWTTALKVIDLTKDQEIEIHKIMAEYQKMNQIFKATHGKEIRSIREEHDKQREGHDKQRRDVLTTILIGAPKDQAAVSDASQKRMVELMELAPDVTTYQEKAWNLLTQEQQTSFQKKYQELIDEEQKRKEERMKNDRLMGDEMQEGGFAPKDSKGTDKSSRPGGDKIQRHKDSDDQASLRRIRFLQRLQRLQED